MRPGPFERTQPLARGAASVPELASLIMQLRTFARTRPLLAGSGRGDAFAILCPSRLFYSVLIYALGGERIMADTKRLVGFRITDIDPKGARVTFNFESEGGRHDSFSLTDDMFSALVRFVLDVDEEVRQRRTDARPEPRKTADSLLLPPRELDLLIDVAGECALLRARTGLGRMVQIELSEELLLRLQDRVPRILTELRERKRGRHH
jgi:hypothetical protein